MNVEEMRARIEKFEDLKEGWDGDKAKPIHVKARMAAMGLAVTISKRGGPWSVAPMGDGGIRFERYDGLMVDICWAGDEDGKDEGKRV